MLAGQPGFLTPMTTLSDTAPVAWLLIIVQLATIFIGLKWLFRLLRENALAEEGLADDRMRKIDTSSARHAAVEAVKRLSLDVWLPLAAIVPVVVSAFAASAESRHAAWLAVGFPIWPCVGALGFWLASNASHTIGSGASHSPVSAGSAHTGVSTGLMRALIAVAAVAVYLMLLAASDGLPLLVGHVAMGIAVLLLWLNVPDDDIRKSTFPGGGTERSSQLSGERLLMGIVLMSAVQASVVLILGSGALHTASLLLAAGWLVLLVSLVLMIAGSGFALRLAAWAAVFGVLFGTAAHALRVSYRSLFSVVLASDTEIPHYIPSLSSVVARGFGGFAYEATALLVAGVIGLSSLVMWRRGDRLIMGVAVMLIAIVGMIAGLAGVVNW